MFFFRCRKIFFLSLCCLIPSGSQILFAQTFSRHFQYAAWFGLGTNSASVSSGIAGIPLPPAADTDWQGSSFGFSLGFDAAYILSPFWDISLRAAYRQSGLTMQTEEVYPIEINRITSLAVITHSAQISLPALSIEPALRIRPKALSPFEISLGLGADFFLSANFSKRQELTEPANGTIVGPDPAPQEGSLPTATQFSLSGRIAYPRSIGKTSLMEGNLSLVPEFEYRYGLSSALAGSSMPVNSWRAGIGLRFDILPAEKTVVRNLVYRRDTTVQFSRSLAEESTGLVSADTLRDRSESAALITETLTVNEHYLRQIPRPKPLLVADIGVKFMQDQVERNSASITLEESLRRKVYASGEERDTLRDAELPEIRFYPTVASEAGLKSWTLTISQRGKQLESFSGEGEPGELIVWKPEPGADLKEFLRTPLDYEFSVLDREGETLTLPRGRIIFRVVQKSPRLRNVSREEFYFEHGSPQALIDKLLREAQRSKRKNARIEARLQSDSQDPDVLLWAADIARPLGIAGDAIQREKAPPLAGPRLVIIFEQ